MDVTKFVQFLLNLLNLIVGFLGVERTKALLDLDEVRRANAIADAIEWVRFSRGANSNQPPV